MKKRDVVKEISSMARRLEFLEFEVQALNRRTGDTVDSVDSLQTGLFVTMGVLALSIIFRVLGIL